MTRRLAVALLASTAFGCSSERPAAVGVGGSASLSVIEGAPSAEGDVPRAGMSVEAEPHVLGTIGGVIAIGTNDGVYASSLGEDLLQQVLVHPDQEGPKSTGAVRQLARRSSDGLLVVAESGLFHSAAGYLLSSPFGQSVAVEQITSLSSFGEDADEELWVVTQSTAYWAFGGDLTEISLEGSTDPISLAIGTAPGQAVIAAGSSAYFADLAAGSAIVLSNDLGSVRDGAAAEDGTVHLATSAGLLSRARSGELTLRTLAAAGDAATGVIAVAASFGAVRALTEQGLVSIESDGSKLLGPSTLGTGSLAIDANGDTWAVESGALFRYETGSPVSFAADVAPFFEAHCQACHDAGATTAPDHDFTDYETAKQWSESIVRRLRATDATTMPPPNEEVLTAADYAVVLRWAEGGTLP